MLQEFTASQKDTGQRLFKVEEFDYQRQSFISSKPKRQMEQPHIMDKEMAMVGEQHDGLEWDGWRWNGTVGELQSLKLSVPQICLKSFTVKGTVGYPFAN
jgi:hypothetical protein